MEVMKKRFRDYLSMMEVMKKMFLVADGPAKSFHL